MAQKWRERSASQKSSPPPLDSEALNALALAYVGRFATSRAKLMGYLGRKLRERGWAGDSSPPVEALADRLVALRYVDDEAYAAMKSGAMQRRGLGNRRIAQTLKQDGIADEISREMAPGKAERWDAAHRFAKRKRIGPFATERPERSVREKHLAAFLRAGHDLSIARIWVDAAPGDFPPDPEDQA